MQFNVTNNWEKGWIGVERSFRRKNKHSYSDMVQPERKKLEKSCYLVTGNARLSGFCSLQIREIIRWSYTI